MINMRNFTEKEIERYYKYNVELVGEEDEGIASRCHQCGRQLSAVELPEGPEKKVACLDCREYFVRNFEELEEWGDI